MPYLLDTNAVIALMKNHSRIVERIRHVGRSELVICAPVEAELWFGVSNSSRIDENRRRLLNLLEWLPSLPFSGDATRYAAKPAPPLLDKAHPSAPTICRSQLLHWLTTAHSSHTTRVNFHALSA